MARYTPQWLQSGSYAASVDRRLLGALWPTAACSGCAVSVSSGMTLNVAAGQVAVPTQNNSGTTLCSSDAVEQVILGAAPPSGSNRIDIVTCHPRAADLDGGANTDFIFDVVVGTAATTPVAPTVPAGQVALAQVYVGGGVASIVAGNITDVRPSALAVGATPVLPTIQARMYRNAAVNVSNATNVMPYDTAETTQGPNTPGVIQNLNTTNARFVIPIAGRYLFGAVMSTAGGATNLTLYTVLRRNGTAIWNQGWPWIAATAQWGQGPGATVAVQCVAGDYLDVVNNTNSATAYAVQSGGATTFAFMSYIGPPQS